MKKKMIWPLVMPALKLLLIAFLPLFAVGASAQQATYYVSPTGNDNNDGLSTASPFATLMKARDIVRTINKSMTGDIIVNVMAGDYLVSNTMAFTNQDGGTNGYNVIYKNYNAIGSARFIGGTKVTDWKLYKDKIYRAQIGSNKGIYTLYENGIRADMARYPKRASARAVSRGGYLTYTATPSGTEFTVLDNANYSQSETPWDPTGKDFTNSWVYGWMGTDFHRWTAGCTKMASATGNSIRTVSSGGLGWPYDQLLVEHCLQLLEWPGEYYYDKATGYLYYYSRTSKAIEEQEIIAPKIVRIIGIVGTSSTSKAQNIEFVGLTFMGTDRGNPQAKAADWACTEAGAYEATVYLSNAKKIKVQNCLIASSGVNAVTFDSGTDTCTLTGSLLEHAGYNGVLTRSPCSANTISNSIIRYAGEIRGHGLGISLTGGETENSLVSHMNIYYTSRAAVGSSAGGNTIEYVTMHDNVQDSGDQGAIYLVTSPGTNPNKINQCVVKSTYSDVCMWDRGATGFYNDRNAAGTIWSNCDAGDRLATGAGDQQWWSFRHDVQVDPQPIQFNNCSWDISYNQNYQYSRTPNPAFNTNLMEYSKIGITSDFPVEYNDLTAKPTMPTGFWIQKGNTQARLRWTQSDRATSYTIKRATVSGGPYTNIGTVMVPLRGHDLGTDFTDKGLINDSTYYYQITASNATNESENSVELSVKPDIKGTNELTGTVIGTVANAAKAFDGDLTSVTGASGWVGLDLGTPKVITGLEYTPTDVDGGSLMRGEFQGSNDANFASATMLFAVASTKLGALTSMRIPQAVYNKAAFRYVRFYNTTNGTVGELKFFGHVGDGLIPIITSDTIAKGRVGTVFNYTISASNLPTSYNAIDLPTGITINKTTGLVTGIPDVVGSFPIKIIAINAYGSDTTTVVLKVSEAASLNLIAYYTFNQTEADSSGNAWNATLNNAPIYATGKYNNAVSLDGTNDYVSLPAGMFNSVTDMTITAWVKPTTITNWARIFDFGTGTSAYMFLSPNPAGTKRLRFGIKSATIAEQAINSTSSLTADTWTHVAVVLSGNIGTIYVNGIPTGTNTSMTITPAILGNTTQNYIGKSQFSADTYYNGLIDDFRIYGNALSSADIISIMGGATLANKNINDSRISIYPNPVNDIIHIQNSEGAIAQIYTALGALLYTSKITDNNQTIDMSKLSSGIYFVTLTDNGTVKSCKIIKK